MIMTSCDEEDVVLNGLRQIRRVVCVALEFVGAILLVGCGAATTVTPLVRAGDTLTRPDRLLVYDFEVTPVETDLERGSESGISGSAASDAQTDEEIQVGKAMAKALTGSVVRELRSRGIENVYRATDASAPGEDTASIKGRFLRLGQGDRTHTR